WRRGVQDVVGGGGPGWLPGVTRSPGDLNGVTCAHLLHPYVELAGAVRAVRDEIAVRRPRRPELQAVVEGQARQGPRRCRRGGVWLPRDEKEGAGEKQE